MISLNLKKAFALVVASAFAGCTSGNSAIEPPFKSVNLASNKLGFAIGTANIATAAGQSLGLNAVATFRQPSGASATLLNTPSIAGPSGFKVPASNQAGLDAGTSTISATPQTAPGVTAKATTFGTLGLVYGYGIAPDNSDESGAASFAQYTLPFYSDAAAGGAGFPGLTDSAGTAVSDTVAAIGGSPAFPTTMNGLYPSGFFGFNEGFVDFAATPVSGTYALSVVVPTAAGSSQASQTFTATSSLNATQVLGAFAAPTVMLDGKGGATVTATLPAGVTEAYVNIEDLAGGCHFPAGPQYFTLRFTASGSQSLSDTLGATNDGRPAQPSICTAAQNGAGASGDDYVVSAVGFDYPAFAAAYPASTSQTPTLVGAAGQADVTTSYPAIFTSP